MCRKSGDIYSQSVQRQRQNVRTYKLMLTMLIIIVLQHDRTLCQDDNSRILTNVIIMTTIAAIKHLC